ncbi:MAG: nuclear transport factor 2 family protein [Mucilaginibacter sp.]|jgi:ketosteroid isomerase-like protein|uniref:YybH family protein n=1 Tax=Mucilaginibacter sp. TaxID=1882438 RepID=UPI003568AFF2
MKKIIKPNFEFIFSVALIAILGLPPLVMAKAYKNIDSRSAIIPPVDLKKDQDMLKQTSEAIRAGFAHGDITAIMSYHHPDVVKALNYTSYSNGREAVKADLLKTLNIYNLEFSKNKVESLLINGDTAVEQTLFTIKGTPKSGGEPFVFEGRAMIIYIRYKESPTGWATIREIIQPATK